MHTILPLKGLTFLIPPDCGLEVFTENRRRGLQVENRGQEWELLNMSAFSERMECSLYALCSKEHQNVQFFIRPAEIQRSAVLIISIVTLMKSRFWREVVFDSLEL